MNDAEMAHVTGQDGLSVQYNSPGVSAGSLILSNDSSQPYGASAVLSGLQMKGVGGPFSIAASADVGSDTTQPAVRISGSWSDLLAYIQGWTLGDPMVNWGPITNQTSSLGSLGIETTGTLTFENPRGLFNASSNQSYFNLDTQGALYYRQGPQGRPELSFRNISLGARFTDGAGNPGTGTFGIDGSGLLISANHMDLNLYFDLYYSANPGAGNGFFDPSSGDPMILFGWEGGIDNARLHFGSGGIGTGTYTSNGLQYADYDGSVTGSRSEGLNFTPSWDFGPNFAWRLGQSGSAGSVEVRFTNWQRLGGSSSSAAHDLNLPMILDTVTPSFSEGGICFGGNLPTTGALTSSGCSAVGGTMEELPVQSPAFAMVMRDGGLHAYNTDVQVIDGATTDTFNWSLLYTFGKLDANIHLYPTQNGGYPGLKSDVVLGIQSPGYWDAAQANFDPANSSIDPNAASRWATNTHFMIADTNTAVDVNGDGNPGDKFAFGLMNADLLWKAKNLFLRLLAPGDITNMPGGFALQSNSLTEYHFRGLLGGGDLTDMSKPVRIALLDVNLATNQFVFVLSPAPNPADEYVGFNGLLDFNSSSYVSIAEPSSPSAAVDFSNVTGRISWQNGRVELRSSASNSDGRPSLTIANDLLFGSTAGGSAFVGDVTFGGRPMGTVAIPSGQWYSSITLKPQ